MIDEIVIGKTVWFIKTDISREVLSAEIIGGDLHRGNNCIQLGSGRWCSKSELYDTYDEALSEREHKHWPVSVPYDNTKCPEIRKTGKPSTYCRYLRERTFAEDCSCTHANCPCKVVGGDG